jgi:hypothetical protein
MITLSRSPKVGKLRLATVTFEDEVINMADHGAAGCHGAKLFYNFPLGHILVLGAVGSVTITAGSGGISDTASAVASVGTELLANDNATLTGAEADIVPSTAATMTAGVGTAEFKSTGILISDGTVNAKSAILNIAIPDAGSSGNDTITINGTVTITWINLGN